MSSLVDKRNQNFFFSTSVSNQQTEEDGFIVEFYPVNENLSSSVGPAITTKNFEELINLIEQLDE
ncbi:MAG: hypothetical protein Q8934_08285 [Bacillota bacterium]|nr:hypothetical protein [Bacillota bacterium]